MLCCYVVLSYYFVVVHVVSQFLSLSLHFCLLIPPLLYDNDVPHFFFFYSHLIFLTLTLSKHGSSLFVSSIITRGIISKIYNYSL